MVRWDNPEYLFVCRRLWICVIIIIIIIIINMCILDIMPTFYECHVEASMKMMSKSLSVLSCNHRGAAAARGKTGSHDPTDRRIRGTLARRWKTAEIKEKANLASCCSDWKQADKTWMQYKGTLADLASISRREYFHYWGPISKGDAL